MIPFHIVTGWLGSGKTTLLKKILHEYGSTKRIAVIQNEFAPSGIDGKELQSTNQDFKLIEINNGSVFCVCQLDNFMSVLEKLALEYEPEAIFLESSGLADPISIAEILQSPKIKGKISLKSIYTVVDALNFEKTFSMMARFKHQVLVADKLIVNKIDLKDDIEETVINQLKKWNPFAEIVKTSHCEIDFADVFEDKQAENRMMLPVVKSGSKPDMGLSLLRMHDKISMQSLISFIKGIVPTSDRIKGFVNLDDGNTVAVQSVYRQYEIKEIENYDGRTELIIFNNKYSPRQLQKMFKGQTLTEVK
jgi:G3E family GTPase